MSQTADKSTTKKATVDDLVAEVQLLNEKANRFDQYLMHLAQAKSHERSLGRWAFGLGVAWFPLVIAGEMLRTAIGEESGEFSSTNLSLGFSLAMIGIFWGLSKTRAA